MATLTSKTVAVVGAGPSGLFVSECLLQQGYAVSLYDQMPSAGCKFLTAGNHGGLNITNNAPLSDFASRYGENEKLFSTFLSDFSPTDLTQWLSSLGVKTCTGSGGKIFPEAVSTSEILIRWMSKLRAFPAFSFFPGHRLSAIKNNETLLFSIDGGESKMKESAEAGTVVPFARSTLVRELEITPDAVVFALGGASWPATGSDGKWTTFFAEKNIQLEVFESANCGFEADWSPYLKKALQNIPLKNICMTVFGKKLRGEMMLTPYGIEGGLVYTFGSLIRSEIKKQGQCTFFLDFLPDWTIEKIKERLGDGPGKESLANYFRKKLNIDATCLSLLRENESLENLKNPRIVSKLIKQVPLSVYRSRPISEAISSAGGVCFSELNESLMLKNYPGFFCAGEMLDWEAPTGGFLIQGCFTTAYRAAKGVVSWLKL